jgi:type IV pilus assembly protein PilA
VLSQLQQKLASYVDVYKSPPPSWKSLSDYSLVMTASGPASETTPFTTTTITLPGNNYEVDVDLVSTNLYAFTATPTNSQARTDGYNSIACLDLNNGATDFKKGPIDRDPPNETKSPSADEQDLVCRECMKTGTC